MKITKMQTIPIEGRAMILKMETDEGIVGFGEPMNYEHWRIVAQAVQDIGEYLIGQDPFEIERHWQAIYRSSYSRAMPSIVACSEAAEAVEVNSVSAVDASSRRSGGMRACYPRNKPPRGRIGLSTDGTGRSRATD